MNRKNIKFLTLALLTAMCAPAFAGHGPLATNVRDAWINARVDSLVLAGLSPAPEKPTAQLTNLEVAQLTAQAAKKVTEKGSAAAAATSPDPTTSSVSRAATKGLRELAEEFKVELAAMDVDRAKLEDRIYADEHRQEKYASLQKDYLKRTGTQISGFSRGYFDTYRGFGPNAIYGPMDHNDIQFGDVHLRSIPVPFVMFDMDVRVWQTFGTFYPDPVSPTFDLRWLSLTNSNDICNLTAGDFYRHYTPLTLWNPEAPVYTMVEPTSYQRVRKDIEEISYMDHGPDYHFRGFEAASDQAVTGSAFLSSYHLQAMGGALSYQSPIAFGQYYAGSQAYVDLFENNLEFKGAGILVADDMGTLPQPNSPQMYRVGSLSTRMTINYDKGVNLTLAGEVAQSQYVFNPNVPLQTFEDWAVLANGVFSVDSFHLTGKFLNVRPQFYSPGAQTSRYSAAISMGGAYLNSSLNIDDALPGYLNKNIFQGVGMPSFAAYDRMVENILPYGDATPNRQGFVLGCSVEIGRNGWLKPQASYDLKLREFQPNWVLNSGVTQEFGVDSATTTATARSFGGWEGALTVDLAKALDGTPKTCDIAFDFKRQSTDLGIGASPFAVDTFIVGADCGPFPEVPLFEGLTLSLAYEQAQSSGNEYVIKGLGSPGTLGDYSFFLDQSLLGQYVYQALNLKKTSWACGFSCPLGSNFEIHGDWFYNQYTWADMPGYDRRENIWRLTYEVSF